MIAKQVYTFNGGKSVDKRGAVSFINDFTFKNIKRFYTLENASTKIIRAFHGHLKEEKYVYVMRGSILLCVVPINRSSAPSKNVKVERFFLSSKRPQIVFVPKGFANGFRTLEKNTTVIIFSTRTLKQSQKDDYRYPYDYWGKSIWENK